MQAAATGQRPASSSIAVDDSTGQAARQYSEARGYFTSTAIADRDGSSSSAAAVAQQRGQILHNAKMRGNMARRKKGRKRLFTHGIDGLTICCGVVL
jgi:hypothetical protein